MICPIEKQKNYEGGFVVNVSTTELGALKEKKKEKKQGEITVKLDTLKRKVQRVKNWTAPGPDMPHAYCLNKFTSLHGKLL